MNQYLLRPLLLGAFILTASLSLRAQYASEVISYTPGTGVATEFGTGLPFSLTSSALGEPSRVTPGLFGGPVDPFAPAYLREQILSVGAGGSVTVKFAQPIRDSALNQFGVDFQVFGSAGFVVTNAFADDFSYIGTPATDGSMFSAQTGESRVSVSTDGITFYELDPALTLPVDGLFPTDGQGNFGVPVNPAFSGLTFAGKSLAEIRALYAGSGGGMGYDLAWARNGSGGAVSLAEISYVRIEVLSGRAEIDGFSAVAAVPEPATWALLAAGVGLVGLRQWNRP
jgi:hypothetical protein